MCKKIGIAVIGNGNRARGVLSYLFPVSQDNIRIVSVYDPDKAEMEDVCKVWNMPDALCCNSSVEAITAPGVDWVMIFSPNVFHKQHILEGFQAGKHVFSEKPLATSIEDCKMIYDAWQQSGQLFATGFVLRYANIYRITKEILDSGKLGRLLTLEANEHIRPGHGGYIMCNWRRLTRIAGPHILEKCCHDLDLINWFCQSLPSKVVSFGGREFFRPENRCMEEKYGKEMFHMWRDPHRTETPFSDDTDLMDNQVSIAEYRNRIRVSFTSTMSNAIPERRMSFHCSEGNLDLDLYKMQIRYKNIADENETVLNFDGDFHGGGDAVIMKELFDTMQNGTAPSCSGNEGLESAVFALALDQAAQKGAVVDLEPVWKSLGR